MFELYRRHVTINFIISELDITKIIAMYHNILMLKKTFLWNLTFSNWSEHRTAKQARS